MSNLTDLLPAGAGGKQVNFVASGTLGSGVTVGLKTDGTVEAVAVTGEVIPNGSSVTYNSTGRTDFNDTAFNPNTAGQFVVVYQDDGNSSYGTAIVGTVSGSSISFGTPSVFASELVTDTRISFDPNSAGKFVVSYKNSTGYGTCIIGSVSGTSITFGTSVNYITDNPGNSSVAFNPTEANQFIVVFGDGTNLSHGTAIVGTVSGTSISYGSKFVYNAGNATLYNQVAFDASTAGKFVVGYRDVDTYGKVLVGTISGASLSFGSEAVFNSGDTGVISLSSNPSTANQYVLSYTDSANSNYGTAVIATVSGTSITVGSEVVFNSGTTYESSIAFCPTISNQLTVAYQDRTNTDRPTVSVGTVSGTGITFGSEIVLSSVAGVYTELAFDPNYSGRFVVVYKDNSNSSYGTAILGQLTASNSTSFIGISDAAISDTASGSVTIKGGISTNVTGLTANQSYYVQADGTLATTSSSVLAGKALSSTSINLDYTT